MRRKVTPDIGCASSDLQGGKTLCGPGEQDIVDATVLNHVGVQEILGLGLGSDTA